MEITEEITETEEMEITEEITETEQMVDATDMGNMYNCWNMGEMQKGVGELMWFC